MGQAAQGKSTLAASYLKLFQKNTVWLHLSKENRDHTNLFCLIINALNYLLEKEILHAMGRPLDILGTKKDISRQLEILAGLFSLINKPTYLVLDDLEALDSEASSFSLIQGIMENMPGHIWLFLISRRMPPLSIQKFKIKKKILVLDNRDIAFTLDETEHFFAEKEKTKHISPARIRQIHTITEGWPGGLTLFSESFNSESDFERLLFQLSWKTIDFFSEEIFLNQKKPIRKFLVAASFFDTIDPEILACFTDISNPVEILTDLERRNLFIQRLEQKNRHPVFRFNKMFKDFLENILKTEKSEKEYKDLCKKAGMIFDQKKDFETAIKYYIRADEFTKVSELVKKTGTDMVIKTRFADLATWIDTLPLQTIWQDPWLIYYLTMTRRIRGGRQTIDDFLKALVLFREKNDTRGAMLCLAHLIEAAVFLKRSSHEIKNWIQQGEELLISIRDQVTFTYARAVLWQHMGFGWIAGTNDILRGISACKNACILGEKIKNSDIQLNATIVSILGYVHTCDFDQAEQALSSISTLTSEGIHPEYRALKNLVNIQLLLKKGEFKKTEKLLTFFEKDIETFGLIFLYPGFIETRAMFYIYTENYDKAVQDADHLSDFSILSGNYFYEGLSCRIRGTVFYHMESFETALKEAQKSITIIKEHPRGDIHLYLARILQGLILMNLKDTDRAEQHLIPALDYFTRFSATLSQAETTAALGIIMWIRKQKDQAFQYIKTAVQIAESEGYTHFIIMGPRDFTRTLLLKAVFDINLPSSYIQSLISEKYARYARQEIETLEFIPGAGKRKQIRPTLKKLFGCTLPLLSIKTFGKFLVFRKGSNHKEIKWEGSKPRLLLKSIIIHGKKEIPKEVLIEDVWPESSGDSGEKKFKINLYRLRKVLEPNANKELGYFYIKLENGFVSLDSQLICLDVDDFLKCYDQGNQCRNKNQPEKALSFYKTAETLYQGDFLANDPYMDWIDQKRNELKAKYMDLLKKTAKIYSEKNEINAAISYLKKIIQTDPVMESAYRDMMVLYSKTGRDNSAIQIYKQCKTTMHKEIGTDPDRKTVEIYEKIKKKKKI